MAEKPEGRRCDTVDRWFNRVRWVGPFYAIYRIAREFLG
ncbi:hypothetical protein STBA_71040 [Streptomyces sp. MP131-18]|nr:hypothetical protein STBA_71040 [Streptomyces sp. MP131-18]